MSRRISSLDRGVPWLAEMELTAALEYVLDAVVFGDDADAQQAVDALMALDTEERYFTLLPLRKVARQRGPDVVAAAEWLQAEIRRLEED